MKKQILLLLLAVLAADVVHSQIRVGRAEIADWKSEAGNIPETYNRASSYVYLVNGDEFVNLFNGAKYNSEDRKKYNLKKNDRPSYLNLSFIYKLKDKDGEIQEVTLPTYFGEVTDRQSMEPLTKVVVLDKVRQRDLPDAHSGDFVATVLSNNKNTEFWKGAYDISKGILTSAALTATGNVPGAIGAIKSNLTKNSLTKNLNQQLDYGFKQFQQSMDDIKSDKKIQMKILVRFYTPDNNEELVRSATLYEVRWDDKSPVVKKNIFNELRQKQLVKISDVENIAKNEKLPMILVIETRSRPNPISVKPEFTETYRDLIEDEHLDYPLLESKAFLAFLNAYDVANSAYSSLDRITTLDDTHSWNNLLEAINNYYLFKTAYQESEKNSHSFSKELSARYNQLDIQLLEKFGPIDGPNTAVARRLIDGLTNESKKNTVSALESELAVLNDYKTFLDKSSLTNVEKKMSYERYLELKKKYEDTLMGLLIQNRNPQVPELEFYQAVLKNYPDCSSCATEANQRIFALTQNTIANLQQRYTDQKSGLMTDFKNFTNRYSQYIGLQTNPHIEAAIRTRSDDAIKENLKHLTDLYTLQIDQNQSHQKYQDELSKWITDVTKAKSTIESNLVTLDAITVKASVLNVAEITSPGQSLNPPATEAN